MKFKRFISSLMCVIMAVVFTAPAVSAHEAQAETFASLSGIAATSSYADGWHKDSNGNYFFTKDGAKLTGWYTIDDANYYFNSKGIMQTGWVTVGSDSYYLQSDGRMAVNTTLSIGGKSYSFDKNGRYYQPKQAATSTKTTKSSSSHDYVLNTNTGKFHNPNCSSVSQMKDKNKAYYTGDRQDVIDMGYVPCKKCNP